MIKLSMRGLRGREWWLIAISIGLVCPAAGFAQPFSAQEQRRWEAEAKQVTIIRDKWGIPHIYGKADSSVVFGLLYAECQEDFSRVEKNYLEQLGRQAEAYGENYLYTDVMMRLIYDSAQAVADYNRSPAWMHALLDAFADGVNYYLWKHPEVKPLVLRRFEPWYALMFTDGSVSATSTGGVRLEEIKSFYSSRPGVAARHKSAPAISDVEKMVLEDRGIKQGEMPDEAGGGDTRQSAGLEGDGSGPSGELMQDPGSGGGLGMT